MAGIELGADLQFNRGVVLGKLGEGQRQHVGVVHILELQLLLQIVACRQRADQQAAAKRKHRYKQDRKPELLDQ